MRVHCAVLMRRVRAAQLLGVERNAWLPLLASSRSCAARVSTVSGKRSCATCGVAAALESERTSESEGGSSCAGSPVLLVREKAAGRAHAWRSGERRRVSGAAGHSQRLVRTACRPAARRRGLRHAGHRTAAAGESSRRWHWSCLAGLGSYAPLACEAPCLCPPHLLTRPSRPPPPRRVLPRAPAPALAGDAACGALLPCRPDASTTSRCVTVSRRCRAPPPPCLTLILSSTSVWSRTARCPLSPPSVCWRRVSCPAMPGPASNQVMTFLPPIWSPAPSVRSTLPRCGARHLVCRRQLHQALPRQPQVTTARPRPWRLPFSISFGGVHLLSFAPPPRRPRHRQPLDPRAARRPSLCRYRSTRLEPVVLLVSYPCCARRLAVPCVVVRVAVSGAVPTPSGPRSAARTCTSTRCGAWLWSAHATLGTGSTHHVSCSRHATSLHAHHLSPYCGAHPPSLAGASVVAGVEEGAARGCGLLTPSRREQYPPCLLFRHALSLQDRHVSPHRGALSTCGVTLPCFGHVCGQGAAAVCCCR